MSCNESGTYATVAGATGLHITAPEHLIFGSSKVEAWKLFYKWWKNYTLLSGLYEKWMKIQVALFENCLGADVMKIYQDMQFATDESEWNVTEIIYALEELPTKPMNILCFDKEDKMRVSLSTIFSVICKFCQKCATFVTSSETP